MSFDFCCCFEMQHAYMLSLSFGNWCDMGVQVVKVRNRCFISFVLVMFNLFCRRYESERATISDQLWADYAVKNDTASFLTGLVHWANRSLTAVTVADVTLPGALVCAAQADVAHAGVIHACHSRLPVARAGAPLVYVNGVFAEMSGYSREEVLGRNCRFLQGPETEPEMVASMQACIALGEDITCHRLPAHCPTVLLKYKIKKRTIITFIE